MRRFVSRALCGLLVIAPLLVVGYLFALTVGSRKVTDFENAFYPAAEAVMRGEAPYPALSDSALAAGTAYVYTPVTAIAVAPLTVFSAGVAGILAMALLAAVVGLTLLLLGVRDWRCFALAYCWPPVFSAIQTGNVTILLGLAATLVWRFRDRPAPAGASLGVSLALKALLWPLLFWLVATRRWRTAVGAVLVAVLAVIASWAVVGFAGLEEHPELVRRLTALLAPESYTIYALGLDLGASAPLARALAIGAALALLMAVVVISRRGDERRAFALAVVAVLACTPLVWLHYFALLLVVVGVTQPSLSAAWLVPLAMYFSTATHNGSTVQTAVTLGTVAATAWLALRRTGNPVTRVVAPAAARP